MEEERKRILEMLEQGKINAEEAARLLSALGESGPGRPGTGARGRYLKIYVEDPDEDTKVNIRVPVSLIKVATKFIPSDAKATINNMEIDLEELLSAIDTETEGEIMNMVNEDGEVVVIRIE